MRLNELYLDNFGIFRQKTIGPISDSITVFYGPNEAGKSTLLAFIRGVLFDFPRQYNAQHYPSLSPGDGGRITLSNDRGIFIVERKVGSGGGLNVITPDGPATSPQTALRHLTGNATSDIFRNVFAFSLDELQSVASLDQANEIIYNAAQGAPQLPNLKQSLEQRKRQIYSIRGSTQEVPRLLNALREVDGQLRAIDDNAARYGELTARKAEIDIELADAGGELSRLAARRAEIGKLQAGADLWLELSGCETQLQDLPRFPRFPDTPVPRLESIEEKLRQAREDREEVAAQLRQAEAEAAGEIPDEPLLPDKDSIESIRRARSGFDKAVIDLPERQAELQGMEANLAKNLADMGHGWSESELQAFDTSLVIQNQAAQWKQRVDESDSRARQAQSQLAQERRELQDRQDETREAQEKLPAEPPPMDAPTLAERQNALRSARGILGEYERHRQNRETLRGQLNALAASRESPGNPPRHFNPVLLALLGAAALLMAATALAGGYFVLGVAGGLIMGIISAAVLLAGGAVLWHTSRPAPDAASSLMDSTLARQTGEAEMAAESARQSLLTAAATLDIDGQPDATALDSAAAKLESARNALDAWIAADALAAEAARRQERQQQRTDAAVAEQESADAAAQETQRQWCQWLAERGLNETLPPDAISTFLARIETTRASLSEAEGMRRRVAAIDHDIEQFRQQVAPLASRHGISLNPGNHGQLASAADRLIQRLDEVQSLYSRREQAGTQAQEIRRLLENRKHRVQSAELEQTELLAAGDTDDAEEFRRRARQHQERQKIERHRDELRRSLEQISGPGDRFDAFLRSLQSTDPETLNQESALLQDRCDQLEARRNALREARGGIDNELAQLANEDESSALRIRKHAMVEQLREHARQWSRLTIAEALLEKTRQMFEQERQPSVIRHAQDFFASVTGQRYQRLYAPIGEQTITVTDADNASRQPAELSRGTREQLYLALRFGLIREFGEHAERLPVVVDEALVNFDPQRARLSAQSFAQLSETNQVLVFTCHPDIADMFAETTGAEIVDISR